MKREFKEYVNSQFDHEFNYNEVLDKVKGSGMMEKKKILKIVAVVMIVLVLGAMAPSMYANIRWNIEYKEYQNRKVDYGVGSINTAVDEYEENINMDYVFQDEIGVKLNGLMITNDYFQMDVDFKFPEDTQINTDTFNYGFAVYDESNNIYGILERFKMNEEKPTQYWKKLYKDLKVDYNRNDVFAIQYQDSCSGATIITSEKGHIVSSSNMTSSIGFPKSKKIYIRIFDVGYFLYSREGSKLLSAEDVTISDAEWILEVEVPETFYQRETVELKIKEEIDGFKLTKAEVTETGILMKVKLEGMLDIISAGMHQSGEEFDRAVHNAVHIEDQEGNQYHNFNLGTTGDEEEVKMRYDISKKDIKQKTFYLCVTVKGKSYRVELEK